MRIQHMTYKILDWNTFQKRMFSLTGKDMERINGTEVHRGPVASVGYDFEGKVLINLDWIARLSDVRKAGWIIEETGNIEIKFLIAGFQIIEWSDGRISIDDPVNPLAPTYMFLTKESQLKYVQSFE
jgi:hypothetical protein